MALRLTRTRLASARNAEIQIAGKACTVTGPTKPRAALGEIGNIGINKEVQKKAVKTEATKKIKVPVTKVEKAVAVVEQPKPKTVVPVKPKPEVQVIPEPASPTPMETSGCAPADLCQAFSDVILHTAVRDVDADDYENPMLCSEYVKEIYKYLRQLEVEQNVRATYLQGHEVTGNMRAILVDWLVQVSLKFRLLQETMYLTVGIIDRFLQDNPVPKKQLQLVG
ncbi:hypothetical protein CgunFtcFv8_025490 [Champsocephalus gunnari]|nr:hypothetical protein CgunFtcFv8_025490 [Champsocephalus gunnari]